MSLLPYPYDERATLYFKPGSAAAARLAHLKPHVDVPGEEPEPINQEPLLSMTATRIAIRPDGWVRARTHNRGLSDRPHVELDVLFPPGEIAAIVAGVAGHHMNDHVREKWAESWSSEAAASAD